MEPEERQIIQAIGLSLLQNWVMFPAIALLCYGSLVPISVMVAYSSAWRHDQTWLVRGQSIIIYLGILTFTANLVVNLGSSFSEYQFFESNIASLSQRAAHVITIIGKWDAAQSWFELLPPVINDAFIIWRAWVVFGKRRWALYISILFCLCTLIVALVYLGIYSNPSTLMAAILSFDPSELFLLISITILSFITNSVATCFIGWMLWSHTRLIRRLDAGAVYAFLQLIYVVVGLLTRAGQSNQVAAESQFVSVYRVVSAIYFCISCVYPALTIALVHGPFSVAGVQDTVNSFQMDTGA